MPKEAKTASDIGFDAIKVRIVFPGSVIHVLSETEPVVTYGHGSIVDVDMDLITGTIHGDTIGFIRWSEVIGITWRST